MKAKYLLFLTCLSFTLNSSAQQTKATYKNPILHLDYSDPDVCKAGDDFYMTASSFNCIPVLPILHSKDLVNWKLIGYAISELEPKEHFSKAQHGNGVWAPAIRFHKDTFYIYYGDPDFGIFMLKSAHPDKDWSKPHLVKAGKGLIDPCPFWDEDGKAYLVHGWAGSRSGIKSILSMTEMTPDGRNCIGPNRVIFDGHEDHPTIEGPKMYKRNGFYYILAPAGGVKPGWQTALRSKQPFGPYEAKIVLSQGKTKINGPHQGGLIELESGESWFIHFQDKDAYGRIVHLNPVQWVEDWPVMGKFSKGTFEGEPVLTHKKPNVGKNYPDSYPETSDQFNQPVLGLQWQWHANPMDWWHFCDEKNGLLRLYSVPVPEGYKNLWDCPNLLLQKFPEETFFATTKITFKPNNEKDIAGFVVMGQDYSAITIQQKGGKYLLSKTFCKDAHKGQSESIEEEVEIPSHTIYLKIEVNPKTNSKLTSQTDAICRFYYSLDGIKYQKIGTDFTAKAGRWIGAKIGYYHNRMISNNDGGALDIDFIEFDLKR